MKLSDIDNKTHKDDEVSSKHKVLCMLINDEWLSYYQYWSAAKLACGAGALDVIPEFEEHAADEEEHAELLTDRLLELGGHFITDPSEWKAHAHPWTAVNCHCPKELLKITLEAEEAAIHAYEEALPHFTDDPVTHKLLVEILDKECEHSYELRRIIKSI